MRLIVDIALSFLSLPVLFLLGLALAYLLFGLLSVLSRIMPHERNDDRKSDDRIAKFALAGGTVVFGLFLSLYQIAMQGIDEATNEPDPFTAPSTQTARFIVGWLTAWMIVYGYIAIAVAWGLACWIVSGFFKTLLKMIGIDASKPDSEQ